VADTVAKTTTATGINDADHDADDSDAHNFCSIRPGSSFAFFESTNHSPLIHITHPKPRVTRKLSNRTQAHLASLAAALGGAGWVTPYDARQVCVCVCQSVCLCCMFLMPHSSGRCSGAARLVQGHGQQEDTHFDSGL
jgi:hypothetical protein